MPPPAKFAVVLLFLPYLGALTHGQVSPEGSVAVSPLNETFNRGDNVTFTCSTSGGPDNTFQWLRNGTELVNETSESFVISEITFTDGDEYTCVVSNAAGSESVSTFFFVSPEIIQNPMDVNIINGSFINIMCDAEAFPCPEFEWVHIGGDICSNIMGTDTNMLVFNPVLFGDEGDYVCTATSNGISVVSGNATITVSPEGSVVASPPVIDAMRNTSVEFICNAMGGPGNTFTWTRLSDEQMVSDEQRLQILIMAALDGSQYECLVENEAGNETTAVVLNVAVAIDVPPMDTNVTTTEEFFLTCTASGYPAPFISWIHNSTDIDENDNRINVSKSNGLRFIMSTLAVTGAMMNDSGEYSCNATNTFSIAIGDPVIVLVQDTPEQPQNIAGRALNTTAIQLNWFEPHGNNARILGYRVRYTRPGFLNGSDVELSVISEMAVVIGLHPGVTYNFTVIAFNEIGDSRESAVAMVATEEIEPATPPQNVMAFALSSTEIMVIWEDVPMINQNGIIINYEVQFEPLDFPADIFVDPLTTTNLSLLVTGLEEYVNHNISVRAYTSVGPGPYSDPVTERTLEDVPATPPQNVHEVVISSTEIVVIWDEIPGLDQNGIVINYEVQIEPLDFPADIFVHPLTTTNLLIRATGLEEYINYNISVRAYTSVGPGPYSDPVTVRTLEDVPATPPQNVQEVVISSTEIMVTWDEIPGLDQNGIIINYEVQVEPLDFPADIIVNPLTTANLLIFVTGLEEYVNYNISVRAYTSVGPGPYSDPVTVRTLEDVPAKPPQNVQATTISSTEIMVTWDDIPGLDRNGIITNYEVQIEALDFPADIFVDPLTTTTLLILVTGLEEYVNYNISVRAYTSVGPGPYSDPMTERTLEDEPATPPQNVQAAAFSSTQIMVTWNEVPAIDQNGIITTYEVRYDPLQFTGVLIIEHVNTTDTSVVLTGLQGYVEYNVSVRAYTSVGPGPFSEDVTERTIEDRLTSPPQNVHATAVSSTAINVIWEEVPVINGNGIIITYEVQVEPLDFNDSLTIIYVNTTNLLLVITGLQEYVEYNIRVRAFNTIGPGPFSPPATERTLEDEPAMSPQNIEITAVSSTAIMVTWEEVLAIDENGIIINYEVQFELLEFTETLTTSSVNTTDLTVTIGSLQEYVEYDVSVRAYTSVGPGPYSNPVTERTLEDRPATPPQHVRAIARSSTKIMGIWEEVLPHDQNGIITNYEVQFVPLYFTNILDSDSINTTDLFIVISGLQEYVEYNVSVRAYTSVGPSPFTVAVNRTFEDKPATSPRNVETSALSSTEIMVTWVEIDAIDENGIIINYEVQYQPLQFTNISATTSINTTELSTNITALQEYVDYNISVRAYTSVGAGPYSDPVTQRTLEDSPAGFPQNAITTALTSTEIRVNWDPVPAIEENGIIITYEILYEPQVTFNGQIPNKVFKNTTSGSVSEMILNDLQEFVVYNITVRAYTSIGSGPFNPNGNNSRTFEDVPVVAPDNLMVKNVSANELAISWERPTEIDINGLLRYYIIEYCIVNQSNTLLTVNVTGDMLSTVLNNLNNFTVYNVSVAAFTVGSGQFSSEIERTCENVPGESPQNVETRNESSTTISVQWESPPQEFLFGILRGYIIRFVPGEMDIVDSTELIPSNTTFFTLENLLEFTNYSIEVTAVTGAGEGPYSPPVYVVTNQDTPGGVDLPQPVQTDDFSEFVNGVINVTVRWDPPQDPNGVITQYNVELVAISTNFPDPHRDNRHSNSTVQQECIMGGANSINRSISVPGTMTSATLEDLTAFSTYEFRVQGQTMIGLGPFSEPQSFSTPEFVPTEPRDLTVQYLNSSSLEITWNHPLCDYGVRTNYTVTHEPMLGPVGPLGEVGIPGNPSVQNAESTSLIITELTPNTNYNVTVYASTSAGPGSSFIVVNQTDEDIPQVVTNLDIVSVDNANPGFRNNVIVQITWTAPSLRNGSFNYNLTYIAVQTDNFPEFSRDTTQDSVIIAGSMEEFTIINALPFANYTITIFAFNIKLNAPGDAETEANRSVAIDPTAVTNLQAVPNSFSSIRVTWSIPTFPNGPVGRYAVYYRDADTVQVAPIQSEGYNSHIVPAAPDEIDFELVIEDLVAFTFYAIHVQPLIGGDNDLHTDFFGDVDLEILQRTNSTTAEQPTVGITDAPTIVPTLTTIFVYLPPTSQLVTGPLMLYAVIVVDTRQVQRDFLESPPNSSQFDDAGPFDENLHQTYYITAAWDNSSSVPSSFLIGDESTTEVNGTTYVNGRLRQGRQYAVFYRIEIVSDNAESLVVNTDYVFSRTASESNAVGLGVGIFFGLFILILIIVVAAIVVYKCKYADKYTIFGHSRITTFEVALNQYRSEQIGLSDLSNPLANVAHTELGYDNYADELPEFEEEAGNRNCADELQEFEEEAGNRNYADELQEFEGAAGMDDYADELSEVEEEAITSQVPDDCFLHVDTDIPLSSQTWYHGRLTRMEAEQVLSQQPCYSFLVRDSESRPTGYSLSFRGKSSCKIAHARINCIGGRYTLGRGHYGTVPECIAYFGEFCIAGWEEDEWRLQYPVPCTSGAHFPVPVQHFADHVKHLHANDDSLLSEEHSSIEPDHAPSCKATLRPVNEFKNRYRNITSYDHSRVKLRRVSGVSGSDYINANYIDGYNQPNAFIATQGPVPGTVSDFWRMIWEQGTATIVMLTNLEEKGRLKCHKYWPDADGESAVHGTIHVHLQHTSPRKKYIVRVFSLQREGSKKEKIVKQYHFIAWPDHGEPKHPTTLLRFVRKVADSNPTNAGPIVVHCSAGVGRTGTFITLDAQMKRIKAEENLDIFNFVHAMRYRRIFMVREESQYAFIHDALLEVVCRLEEGKN